LNLNIVAKDIGQIFSNCTIDIRIPFLQYATKSISVNWLAEELASLQILDTSQPFNSQPEIGSRSYRNSVLFEKYLITNPYHISRGLYDGFMMQRLYETLVPENEKTIDNIHIILDSRLACTFSEDDHRYHARAIICGTPSIISTSGIIEAPAKPKDFYLGQIGWMPTPADIEDLKKQFAGKYIDYDDHRINCIITGYIIQALFFFLKDGNPFCSDAGCRLFNAHWQEDLISTQINNQRLCKRDLLLLHKFLKEHSI
jgi:hypothetical protein